MDSITATTKPFLLFLFTLLVATVVAVNFERATYAGTTILPNPVNCAHIPGNSGGFRSRPDRCPNPLTFPCPAGYQCRNCSEKNVIHGLYDDKWTCAPDASSGPLRIPPETSTEVGTLQSEPGLLIISFIQIFAGLAGGVSILLAISGAAKYLTSSGNPEEIEEAKGIISHAVGGFLLVFLSVFLLRFIGVDLLRIPGLSAPVGPGGSVTVP